MPATLLLILALLHGAHAVTTVCIHSAEMPAPMQAMPLIASLEFHFRGIDHILTTPEHQKSREAYWGSCMVLPTSEIRKALVLGDGTLDVQVTLTSPGFLWTTKTLLESTFDLARLSGSIEFPFADKDGREGGMLRVYLSHAGEHALGDEEGVNQLKRSEKDLASRKPLGKICVMDAKVPSADWFWGKADPVLKLEILDVAPKKIAHAGKPSGAAMNAAKDALMDSMPQDAGQAAKLLADPGGAAKSMATKMAKMAAKSAAMALANNAAARFMNGTKLAQCNYQWSEVTVHNTDENNSPHFSVCCELEPLVIAEMSNKATVLIKLLDYDPLSIPFTDYHMATESEMLMCSVPADGSIGDVVLDFDHPHMQTMCVGQDEGLSFKNTKVHISLLPTDLKHGPTVFPEENANVKIDVVNGSMVGHPSDAAFDSAFPVCADAPSPVCNSPILSFSKANIQHLSLAQQQLLDKTLDAAVGAVLGSHKREGAPMSRYELLSPVWVAALVVGMLGAIRAVRHGTRAGIVWSRMPSTLL